MVHSHSALNSEDIRVAATHLLTPLSLRLFYELDHTHTYTHTHTAFVVCVGTLCVYQRAGVVGKWRALHPQFCIPPLFPHDYTSFFDIGVRVCVRMCVCVCHCV